MNYFSVLLISIIFFVLAPLPSQAQHSPAPEGPEGSGLKAEYFNGTSFQRKVLSRIDREINFYYLGQSPAPGVSHENYSIRWTGKLYAPTTGTYKLSVRVDDGVRVWLDGVRILDKWQLQEATTFSGEVKLYADKYYDLKIEYYNGPFHGVMQLMWEVPEMEISSFFSLSKRKKREPIPQKYLFAVQPEPRVQETVLLSEAEPQNRATGRTQTEENSHHQVQPSLNEPQLNKEASLAPTPGAMRKNTRNIALPAAEESTYEHLKPGAAVRFDHVLFEQGKYVLLDSSYPELDKLVRTMKKSAGLKIRLEGHTDNVGNPKHNHSLSFFRAKVVATYLIEQGIDASRLEVAGYGSSRPVADNTTEAGRARNRRVQFVVK